jgi:hypothetical protein
MKWSVPPELQLPANAAVIEFLEHSAPSAHTDVASELALAVRGLPGTRTVCPDPTHGAWVAASTSKSRIFALAHGTSALCANVGVDDFDAALADRAMPAAELGPGWVRFDPFDADEPQAKMRARLHRWCMIAFQRAGGAGATDRRPD